MQPKCVAPGGEGEWARYQGSTRPICSESVSFRLLGPDTTYGASLSVIQTDWVPQNAPKRVAPGGEGEWPRSQGSTRPIRSESVSFRLLGLDTTYGASLNLIHTDWGPQNAPKRVVPGGEGEWPRSQGSTRPIRSESVSFCLLGPDTTYGASLNLIHTHGGPPIAPKCVAPWGGGAKFNASDLLRFGLISSVGLQNFVGRLIKRDPD